MDRADLSAAIIADAGETVMALLRGALPHLLTADLAGLERHLQGLGRLLWGQVVEAIGSSACGRRARTACRPVRAVVGRCAGWRRRAPAGCKG